MAYVYWLPKNHLEVLDGHPVKTEPSLARKLYYPAMYGALGLGSSLLTLAAYRRPLWSALQVQIPFVILSCYAGHYYSVLRTKYNQESEARQRHYIETHREHFPDFEMVKIGDILEPWVPVR